MFRKKTKQARADRAAERRREPDDPRDRGGFPGLEGDFESERRRAVIASNEHGEPYEHGEGETPVLPSTTPGLTHP